MDGSTASVIGSVTELRRAGQLVGKMGDRPVVVFWDSDRAWAIEDRCPHMGFPLHRGTVHDGLLTCHWHHARFDVSSGCTLDLWADDAVGFDVAIDGDDVVVSLRPAADDVARLERRLVEGLEEGLTLVIAKAIHGLLARAVRPARIVEIGLRFAAQNRAEGWGPGMTVAQISLNLVHFLEPGEHGRALTQGLAFLGRDTRGRRPRFPVAPLEGPVDPEQLARWYRRFIENRLGQAAERVAATGSRLDAAATERFMFAACTDHVFIDEGHTVDYLNKACEAIAEIGADAAALLLPTVVEPTATATRHEEVSAWREPVDLLPLLEDTVAQLADATGDGMPEAELGAVGWALLTEDPTAVGEVLVDAAERGASREQLARAVAYAAALRLVRFHAQNDVGDWDTVHHTFTSANALHQAVVRQPTPELLRGVVQLAFRVYLDRFLNVPAARVPDGAAPRQLDELEACWNGQGGVDEAGQVVAGRLAAGGAPEDVLAELCRALFREDAGFHWFQSIDAAAAQLRAWPAGSEEAGLILVGATRWLAAHTPTVRANDQVVGITRRLLRGDAVYEDA
ncbi:MAG TPA: Rieske (2Fe-2S) protein [Acidimicrobiales bacterium]|nr:Rieske (2Fe-2S) protein [Acidimicrobiales bacterium]